jgi:hypothetical protein
MLSAVLPQLRHLHPALRCLDEIENRHSESAEEKMDNYVLNCKPGIARESLNLNLSYVRLMRNSICAAIAAVSMSGIVCAHAISAPVSNAPEADSGRSGSRLAANFGKIPLSFEANQGQTDPRVQFLSHGSGYSLFLTPEEVILRLERQRNAASSSIRGDRPEAAPVDTLRMELVGANPGAALSGSDPMPGVVSYFIGNDAKKWRTGIRTYGKVNYAQIYPGVDLVFYGNQRQLEYDFVVAPGADSSRIAWKIGGAGATLDAEGGLVLTAAHGAAGFKKPVVYQMDGDRRTAVECAFVVAGDQIRFKLGSYNHARALIIDPVLSYSSYLGGSLADYIGLNSYVTFGNTTQGLAVDKEGSVYVTGYTYSADFPLEHPYEKAPPIVTSSNGRYPASYVTKFSPDGSSLIYSTYLGGTYQDYGSAIAVDSKGEAYVTGYTNSPDFPVTAGAFQTICGANWTVNDGVYTRTTNCGEDSNVSTYVTKLNAAGTGLVYSTFLGGGGYSEALAIAVDGDGRAYVAGIEDTVCSSSQPSFACFPTTAGALISGTEPGGDSPPFAFVSALDPTGATLLYSTIFGDMNGIGMPPSCGSCNTYPGGIAVDANGNFYLTGETLGAALPTTTGVVEPTTGPLVDNQLAAYRGFVFKFNAVGSSGSALAYGTYLGGHTTGGPDEPTGIAVDAGGNAYIAGYTQSPDFPATKSSFQPTCYGPSVGYDYCPNSSFVAKLNPDATAIAWATYFGDIPNINGDDSQVTMMGPIQLDGKGNVYITGLADPDMPQVNPIEPATVTAGQQFIAEFDPTGSKLLFSTYLGNGSNGQTAAGLAVDTEGNIYAAGNTDGGLITTPGAFQKKYGGGVSDGYVLKIAAHGVATTKLSAAPYPVTPGEAATLTAAVAGPKYASLPTGTVTFKSDAKVVATVKLGSSGTVTYKTPALTAGSYSLVADYSGDETYPANSSAVFDLNVAVIKTSTTLEAAPNPAFVKQTVTFTAKVAADAGHKVPNGIVTFKNGTETLHAAVLNAAGTAAYTTDSLAAGSYTITAVYEGNKTFASSKSKAADLKIDAKTVTTTTLAASSKSVVAATKVTLSATVKSAHGGIEPAGTVTFLDGNKVIGKVTLSKTGTATLATSILAVGSNSIKASYGGSLGDDSSVSSALIVEVTAK